MGLTLTEQLRVIDGTLKPTVISDPLISLTHASGVNAARDFNSGYKIFPTSEEVDNGDGTFTTTPINTKASGYLSKMLSATAKMITSDSTGLNSLMIVMASLISKEEVVTPQVIEGATIAQWEGFINDHIKPAMELFANVRIDEKSEYDALP